MIYDINNNDYLDKVNSFNEFINEIETKEQEKYLNEFNNLYSNQSNYKKLKSLVPEKLFFQIDYIIRTEYENKTDDYIKNIPLFFEKFTPQLKKLCDTPILLKKDKKDKAQKTKQKKTLLYASQLLRLNGRNENIILNKYLLNDYIKDMKESDNYINSLRLINSKGSIIKLDTNEQKQYKKFCEMLKVADVIDRLAQDNNFTNAMLTMTLPPSFHSNDLNTGGKSYKGYTPDQQKERMNSYWTKFRAKLAKEGFKANIDYYGLYVIEGQISSTLHSHSIIYFHEKHKDKIEEIFFSVRDEENKKHTDEKDKVYQFDISHENKNLEKRQKGSSYLMKYLFKTHTTYNKNNLDNSLDDKALRNQALRSYYNVRGFNFFGLNGSITKFNFLVKNYKNYELALPTEINIILKNNDLYNFIKTYSKYFNNEYTEKNKSFIGVTFNKNLFNQDNNAFIQKSKQDKLKSQIEKEIEELKERIIKTENKELQESLLKRINNKSLILNSLEKTEDKNKAKAKSFYSLFDIIFIQKKIFTIFETNEQTKDKTNINQIDNKTIINDNVFNAFELAKEKQLEFNKEITNIKNQYKSNKLKVLTLNTLERYFNKYTNRLQLIKGIQEKTFNSNTERILDDFDKERTKLKEEIN